MSGHCCLTPHPRWLEEHLDTDATSDLLASVDFVLCLDSLGTSDQLKLHVSKPPKEGSAGEVFLKHLNSVSEQVTRSRRLKELKERRRVWINHPTFPLSCTAASRWKWSIRRSTSRMTGVLES